MAEEKAKMGKKTPRAYSRYMQDPVFVGMAVLCLLLGMTTLYFASGSNSATCPIGGSVTGGVVGGGSTDGTTGGTTPTGAATGASDKLQIYVFSEFLCPYCSAAAGFNPTLEAKFKGQDSTWSAPVPGILETYSDKAELVFKHYIIHGDKAQKAAEASECARDQGKFWELHDKMFQNQAKLELSDIKGYAAELGLNTTKFNTCLDSGEKTSVVEADVALAQKLGVTGTPTFFIGGENGTKVVGAQPFSVLKKAIDIELDPALKAAEQQRLADEEKAKAEAMKTLLGLDKTDNKPQIDFFVMSYCPYGNQAEEAIEPVYQNLKDTAIFNPRYIVSKTASTYNSLHGVQEFNQDIRELCVNKYMGIDAYFKFVLAMNKQCTSGNADSCWENVANGLGLDTVKIKACQKDEGSALADKEIQLADALDVSSSPTVFVEGVKYSGARSAQGFQQALCAGFTTKPAACGTALSGTAQAAQGGC